MTQVAETVRRIIAETLPRDLAMVQLDSNLIDDLEAESLDFLDIVFKLERTFDIQITRGALEHAARGEMSEEEFAPAGVLSDAALARLRVLLPESVAKIKPGLRRTQILTLFTVQTFVAIVDAKKAERPS